MPMIKLHAKDNVPFLLNTDDVRFVMWDKAAKHSTITYSNGQWCLVLETLDKILEKIHEAETIGD